VTFFDCEKIFALLSSGEEGSENTSKNFFGQYSSARLKQWDAILSSYQKDNAHLGECAEVVHQRVVYEM
jgi:hypothetical protein